MAEEINALDTQLRVCTPRAVMPTGRVRLRLTRMHGTQFTLKVTKEVARPIRFWGADAMAQIEGALTRIVTERTMSNEVA